MTVVQRFYSPRRTWTASPDARLVTSDGEQYEIEVSTLDGDRRAVIRRAFTPAPVTSADRDSARAALERQAERMGPNADVVRGSFEIRDVKPAIDELVLADDGHLWVRVPAADDWTTRHWDVFDPEGRFLGTVELPARFRVQLIRGDALYGTWRDELDVPYVRRFAIRRPDDGAS